MNINCQTTAFDRSCYFESCVANPTDIYPSSHPWVDYVTSPLHLLLCSSGYKSIHDHSGTVSRTAKAQQAIQKDTEQSRIGLNLGQHILQFFTSEWLTTYVPNRSTLPDILGKEWERNLHTFTKSVHSSVLFASNKLFPRFGNIKYCRIRWLFHFTDAVLIL